MPITAYIYTAILIVGLTLGGTIGYKIEHYQVLKIEAAIKDQKIEAANVLAQETQKTLVAERKQITANLQLDKSHEAYISTSNAYSTKLSNVISSLQFTTSRKGGGSTPDKSNSTSISTTDAKEFTWISRKLLNYLAGESKRANQDGFDKNELMDFVLRDNCGIPK